MEDCHLEIIDCKAVPPTPTDVPFHPHKVSLSCLCDHSVLLDKHLSPLALPGLGG